MLKASTCMSGVLFASSKLSFANDLFVLARGDGDDIMANFGVARTFAAASILGASPIMTAPARRIDSICLRYSSVSLPLSILRKAGSVVLSTRTNGLAASIRVALTEKQGLSFSWTRIVSMRLPVGKSVPVILPAGSTKATLTSLPVPFTPGMA